MAAAKTMLVEVIARAPSNYNKFMKLRVNELKEKYENHKERFSAAALEWSNLSEEEKAKAVEKAEAYIATLNEAPKAPRKKRVSIEKVEEQNKKATKTTRGPSVYNLYISKFMSDEAMKAEFEDRKERFKAVIQKYSNLSEDDKKALAEEFKDALKKPEADAESPRTPPQMSDDEPKVVPDAPKKRAAKAKKTEAAKAPEASEHTDDTAQQPSDASDEDVKPKAKRGRKAKTVVEEAAAVPLPEEDAQPAKPAPKKRAAKKQDA